MLSNSFHSSAKAHSLSSAASLAKAERHNDRGYFSFSYDKSKVAQIVGDSSTLAADVERAINDTFNPYVDEYNARQKRKDRRIDTSAFEYFCNQKNLDVAVEAILQVGDQEFWSRWRKDTIVHRGKKQHVHHEFPENVKAVMNDIYGLQAQAFENIYLTHGAEIAARIKADYDGAFGVAQKAEAKHPAFREIYQISSKERVGAITKLPLAEQAAYADYAEARDLMASVVKLNLIERSENNQMHIKVVTATGHHDEWSPHAHAIGLCWADGYKKGLSSRVAKSVVLNKWALEVLQERLHEIAEQEIAKHPEIFGNEKIKPKEQGRNHDYTTEQIRRQQLAKLEERIEATKASERAAEASERQAKEKALEAQKSASEAEDRAERARERAYFFMDCQRSAENRLKEVNEAISSIEQYELEVEDVEIALEDTNSLIDDMAEMKSFAAITKKRQAEEVFERFAKKVRSQIEWMKGVLTRLFGFEVQEKMPEEERQTPKLEERIKATAVRVDNSPWKDKIEPR